MGDINRGSPLGRDFLKKEEVVLKPLKDYSFVRGFNYTQSNVWTDTNFWEEYDHDIVDRDMGYAERLRLNSARIFLTYSSYVKNKEQFLANVKDFVRTAWAHGITTNPIIYHGMRFLPEDFTPEARRNGEPPKTLLDKSCWVLGERYFDDLYEAIGKEPGLLFWDISNEPGYRRKLDDCCWYPKEPAYRHDRYPAEAPDEKEMKELRYRQELVWEFIRHFCKYVKNRDPENAIGVGNTFIFETEASGTADLVDIIVFHDYYETRSRVREIYEQALELSRKYGKPVINNETCCIGRANNYDMVLELISEYPFGWYVFELMIGADVWNRVHGIVYPDGKVRDPSIVAALFGFYRKRDEGIIMPDVNQEHHVDKVIEFSKRVLEKTKNSFRGDHSRDVDELLEACEYAANLLEGGELVPMAYPPTAKVAAYRRQENPNADEIKDWLMELLGTLKKACHILS